MSHFLQGLHYFILFLNGNRESIEYPVILMEPKNRIVKTGWNAIVSCQVSTSNCDVQWIFNGRVISGTAI